MMFCDSFACSMPIRTCKASQRLADEAIRLILEDEQSLFMLEDISISRMIVCGKCAYSNIDYEQSKEAFRRSISALVEKIDHYNEWGYNPEEIHDRRLIAGQTYRANKSEEIREKIKERRMDRRMKKLKEDRNG